LAFTHRRNYAALVRAGRVVRLLHRVARGSARATFRVCALLAVAALTLSACNSSDEPKSDGQLQAEIVSNMHQLITNELKTLQQAARDLQTAAPATVAGGWDTSPAGTAATAAMQRAWRETRIAWERIEGTVEPLFPSADDSMDSRYEDMVAGGAADPAPLDGDGATGMHAIERILFAPNPDAVVGYETTLPGYWPARWPQTDEEAAQLKGGLFQRLLDDSTSLSDQWRSKTIDLEVVFLGLTGLIASQAEKVSLAAVHQEESRYSGTTLADMRSNLAGTRAIYQLFTPWLNTKPYGMTYNQNALNAFDQLDRAYADIPGEAVPQPPPSWANTSPPSSADLQTPFGLLYTAVMQASDKNRPGSAIDAMNHVAWALGLASSGN
jgi:iron uptake system component EfeO